jgi:hypothetical protein
MLSFAHGDDDRCAAAMLFWRLHGAAGLGPGCRAWRSFSPVGVAHSDGELGAGRGGGSGRRFIRAIAGAAGDGTMRPRRQRLIYSGQDFWAAAVVK